MAWPPQTFVDRVAEREEEARMRAEYFARGGRITHYPRGHKGEDPWKARRELMREKAQQRAAQRKAWREGRSGR